MAGLAPAIHAIGASMQVEEPHSRLRLGNHARSGVDARDKRERDGPRDERS